MPPWPERWRRILERLLLVTDAAGEEALLSDLATVQPAARPRVLAFANAHAMNLAVHHLAFAEQLAQADVLLRDGSGLATLLRWRGQAPGRNLNGTDFIPRLLRQCDGQPLAVLGTREPHLQRGVAAIRAQLMPRSPVVALDGYQRTAEYLALLRAQRPRVVLLAMGMPRQEALALQLRGALDFECLIVCGGAIVDFLAGKVRRAPRWLRRLGLEWLWRLGQEPLRLFMRYVVGNPVFLWRALRLARLHSV
jgi:N-acetylglucosaminyldiphosphoundecaprenol N-acetyl-beta-D-mannosaminyltransferase